MANLTKAQAENIENAKAKFLATQDELNPNMRFADNSFVAKLLESPSFAPYYEKTQLVGLPTSRLSKIYSRK